MEEKVEQAHWHHSAGREFQEAFYILIADFHPIAGTWGRQVERPSYYCAGLAIEHFLKGYLTLGGDTFPNKSHKGHDLVGLISPYKKKIMHFFDLDETAISQIGLLNERYYNNEVYGKDDLRYANKSGLRKSPHPDSLNRIVKKMEDKLMTDLQRQNHLILLSGK